MIARRDAGAAPRPPRAAIGSRRGGWPRSPGRAPTPTIIARTSAARRAHAAATSASCGSETCADCAAAAPDCAPPPGVWQGMRTHNPLVGGSNPSAPRNPSNAVGGTVSRNARERRRSSDSHVPRQVWPISLRVSIGQEHVSGKRAGGEGGRAFDPGCGKFARYSIAFPSRSRPLAPDRRVFAPPRDELASAYHHGSACRRHCGRFRGGVPPAWRGGARFREMDESPRLACGSASRSRERFRRRLGSSRRGGDRGSAHCRKGAGNRRAPRLAAP